jgi:hypothetical protein
MKAFFKRLFRFGRCPVEHVKQMGKPIDARMRLVFTIFIGSGADPTNAVKFYECKLCGARSVVNPYVLIDNALITTVNRWLDHDITTSACTLMLCALGALVRLDESDPR